MTEHYFTEKPTSELKKFKQKAMLRGNEIQFITASGLFSPKQVDKGTKILIESADIKENQSILDLGCGYGIVGLTLKKTMPTIEVTATDINERAISITKENFRFHHLKANIFQSNGFEKIKEQFDVILVNPPQSAGKDLCIKLIKESKEHLKPKGSLQLIARPNKGGKTLSEIMKATFNNVTILTRKVGYCLYKSEKQAF